MECISNTLLPTLELLQIRAEEEVRKTVWQTVGHKLPAELTNLIYDFALAAEDLPADPEIFVEARHVASGEIRTKARLVCEHSIKWENEYHTMNLPYREREGFAQLRA